MNFNNFFDNIYCINLERRTDRWSKFEEETKKNNILNVRKFVGVDGKEIQNPSKLLDGELGVLLTHLKLIQECKNKNFDSVLILEDDVYFSTEVNKLENYMNQIPNDWDFIYFGGNHIYGPPPIKISENILKLNFTVSLHCVAIKNTMFDLILEILPKMRKQVDGCYADFHKSFNAYGITPNIAFQKEDYSDIQNRIVNYNNFFK